MEILTALEQPWIHVPVSPFHVPVGRSRAALAAPEEIPQPVLLQCHFHRCQGLMPMYRFVCDSSNAACACYFS